MSETQNDNNEKSQNYLKIICRIGNWAVRLMFFFAGAAISLCIAIAHFSEDEMVLAFLWYNAGGIFSLIAVLTCIIVGLKLKKKYPDPD